MPRIRLLLTLFLLVSLSARADEDPLCGNMHGIEKFNPLAKYPLNLIRKCIVVYCNPAVNDPAEKKGLKGVDDKLAELQITTSQMNMAIQKFSRTCKALNHDMGQLGPKMDAFKTASYELGIYKGRLSDQYEAIQKSPLQDTFNDVGSKAASQYQQPDCMNQINKLTIDELNAAQDLIDKAQIDCS